MLPSSINCLLPRYVHRHGLVQRSSAVRLVRLCSGQSKSSDESNRSVNQEMDDGGETKSTTSDVKLKSPGGFAEASAKFAQIVEEMKASDEASKRSPNKAPEKEIPFETLLRYSSFMQLGDIEGKIVSGTIYHTFEDDLYIDFGGKFPCVCKRPYNGVDYVRGAKVKLRLNDWELSARFLGSSKDLTLLEADCTLLGLISSPVEAPKKETRQSSRSRNDSRNSEAQRSVSS